MNRFLTLKRWELAEYYRKWALEKYGDGIYLDYFDLDKSSKDYNICIRIIKDIINSDNELLKAYLWNKTVIYNFLDTMDHDDYLEISDFVEEQRDAFVIKNTGFLNQNSKIIGKNIVLNKISFKNEGLFIEHYKEDDAFELFASINPSHSAFLMYAPRESSFSFAILDINNSIVGYIQLYNYDSDTKTAELTYYIFKEYRGKGYAKEAISLLTSYAFDNELKYLKETIFKYKYKKSNAPIELIYAYTDTKNDPSCRLLESLGFEKTGTIHRSFAHSDNNYLDSYRYEMSMMNFNKI